MMRPDQIAYLQSRGCTASDWKNVEIHPESDLSLIKNVDFRGKVSIGKVSREAGDTAGIANALIIDSVIGDLPSIRNIGSFIRNARIGNRVTITNVGRIEEEPEARYGTGTAVAVLDETGSRPVYIYPGLSAQVAAMMTLYPKWTEEYFLPLLEDKWNSEQCPLDIEDGATITDSQVLVNMHIGAEVKIEGALSLINGAIINNAPSGKCIAYIGAGVDAENFIIEDGVVASGALLRNVYVGQGAIIEKRFTAHDSLFFANCSMENGEACALFAGPYSVSMHKSSLLIASQSSFMNAGSGTNFSNHMYKLGPVHWGVMERGVKTASNSYFMWGGRVGAFSLIMGNHKTHPDTSSFPFSYLFSDERGNTIVAPGQMLKSCGLLRDAQKWPKRDRRIKHRIPMHDHIHFDVLNPATIQSLIKGVNILNKLQEEQPDAAGMINYEGLRFRAKSIATGLRLYKLALLRYLYEKSHEAEWEHLEIKENNVIERWVDLAGQIMPRSVIELAMSATNPQAIQAIFDEANQRYAAMELKWAKSLAEGPFKSLMPEAPHAILELNEHLESDRASYKKSLADEIAMLSEIAK